MGGNNSVVGLFEKVFARKGLDECWERKRRSPEEKRV